MDGDQELVFRENVLARRVDAREGEEVTGRDCSLALGTGDSELGVEGDESGSGVGRVDDVAWPAPENRVKLVFTVGAVADVPAILQAWKTVAVIPAPRPLADVARERAGVADLRRANAVGSLREHRVLFSDQRIASEGGESDQATDRYPVLVRCNAIQARNGLQVQ